MSDEGLSNLSSRMVRETSAQKGTHYKDDLCTRLTSEAWHKDCIDDRVKPSSGILITGLIAMNWRSAFHIFDKENAGERKAACQATCWRELDGMIYAIDMTMRSLCYSLGMYQ